jgi:PPM family protein phosphatase
MFDSSSLQMRSCSCERPSADADGYCLRCGRRIAEARDHLEIALSEHLGGITDRGFRHVRNEDAVVLLTSPESQPVRSILVVCDGVSSAHEPDRAAAAAARTTSHALLRLTSGRDQADTPEAMVEAIREADATVCAQPYQRGPLLDPPATTIVAAMVEQNQITVGWVGDSRAYWISEREAILLTRDHSWLNEVVDSGALSEAEAQQSPYAHAITQCLGAIDRGHRGVPLDPSLQTFQAPGSGYLILCTDGLWNYAPEPEQIASLVRTAGTGTTAREVAETLVNYALTRGGGDNVTVAVAYLP